MKRHAIAPDIPFLRNNWRIAPAGEIIDQFGGMVAGDVRARMGTLMARHDQTDRFARTPMAEANSGQACVTRQESIERANAEHRRVFPCSE